MVAAEGGAAATATGATATAAPTPNGHAFVVPTAPDKSPVPDAKPRLERVEFLYTQTPVEGCELVPYVVIRTAAGEAKSAEAIEAKTRGALSVQYRWNRCAAKYSCARRSCLRPASFQFVPLLKIANDRVMSHDQMEHALKESFFCSQNCITVSWSRLRSIQQKFSESCPLRDEAAAQDEDAPFERARAHKVLGREDGVFADPLENPRDISEVAWIRNYAPTAEDVGHILELVCRYVHRLSDGRVEVGPPLAIRSKHVRRIPDSPPERRMMNLASREFYSAKNRPVGTFRVLTYNVLAEIYTSNQTYPNCPTWALAWTYRKRNLIREMAKYEADILCLQEVQADHYDDHFQPYFSRLGYQGCYKVKTRESMGRKGKIDGCATLFRKDMFVLREQHSPEYNTIAQQRTKSSRALNRCLKGNVGLILVLDATDGSGPVVVANTHLFWDPDLTDVKLFQVDAFLHELESVLQTHRLGHDVPIVVGGDFNSEPMSSVYELMTTGSVSMTREDVPTDIFGVLSTCQLRHNLHLRSSYSLLGQEPAFTNYTSNFVGVLDYVWYSPDSIAATAVLEMPDEDNLLGGGNERDKDEKKRDGIPNAQWSSDHIALVTEFQILKPRHTLPHGRH